MCKILIHCTQTRIYILDYLQLKIYSIGLLLKQLQWFLLMVGALPHPTLYETSRLELINKVLTMLSECLHDLHMSTI